MNRSYLATLAGLCLTLLAPAHAPAISPPSVPDGLEVSSAYKVFLVGHAIGTQNYFCVVSPSGVSSWTQFGPQATLFDDRYGQVATHFLSANPDEDDKPRPTWQHSKDTSAVWGEQIAESSDPEFVEPGAIPWLKLRVVGKAAGPTGGGRMAETAYIQRVHTSGGLKPTTACNEGDRILVPYSTDYYFYKAN